MFIFSCCRHWAFVFEAADTEAFSLSGAIQGKKKPPFTIFITFQTIGRCYHFAIAGGALIWVFHFRPRKMLAP